MQINVDIWSAIAAIGQVFGALFTAAAVWLALLPHFKRIRLNLIYDTDEYGNKNEAIMITNDSTRIITLFDFGIYLNRHRINISKLDIELEDLPLTVLASSHVKITKGTVREPYIHEERLYIFLGYCLLGKENPYIKNGDNPKVYFYVKDTSGKQYKSFIGMRKDIIEAYKKERS